MFLWVGTMSTLCSVLVVLQWDDLLTAKGMEIRVALMACEGLYYPKNKPRVNCSTAVVRYAHSPVRNVFCMFRDYYGFMSGGYGRGGMRFRGRGGRMSVSWFCVSYVLLMIA